MEIVKKAAARMTSGQQESRKIRPIQRLLRNYRRRCAPSRAPDPRRTSAPMAEHLGQVARRALAFPAWTRTPIPGVSLSAAGLLALADLSTVAKRTEISGGSSWLDTLLLAPGLHYQQAADALAGGRGQGDGSSTMATTPSYSAIEQPRGGKTTTYVITNPATVRYLQRIVQQADDDASHAPVGPIVVDVGVLPQRMYLRRRRKRRSVGPRANIFRDQPTDLGWLSHLLYLAAPVLTLAAFLFMTLLQEWWGVGMLLALMTSRVLNIWVIKQRARPPPPPPPTTAGPGVADVLTEYLVDLGRGRSVCLRGMAADLQAITTSAWLAAPTHAEGYLEAAAKLIVYLVAALSGNMSQAGALVFMALLLVTAGLLGLSNAHAKSFRMHGRIAAPTQERLPYSSGPGFAGSNTTTVSTLLRWPPLLYRRESTGLTALTDFAEEGQIGAAVKARYPLDERVGSR